MLFNSLSFAIFLPVVFFLYWYLRHSLYEQNTLLLIASYLFYGWWDARFLSLIMASTIVDFILGLSIANSNSIKRKKIYLITSIVFNLGLLGIFKYYNFFLENFLELTASLGIHTSLKVLSIVLPVGISFYNFQTMSYTIDIYRRKLNPTNDFVGFATFVGYFPQLVAGPIERASNLLPQIIKPRSFDYNQSVDGLRQALWGFFKKVVIADVATPLVDQAFANPQSYNASAEEKIIQICNTDSITLVTYEAPLVPAYRTDIPEEVRAEFNKAISILPHQNVPFLLTPDQFFNSNHLNESGADNYTTAFKEVLY